MALPKKRALGRGLDAIFDDNYVDEKSVNTLKISEVEPNKNQPRTHFDEASLRELADSIRNHGVLQPLMVRPISNGGYQIVAGERRWRAARMAGLTEIPVVIKELSDAQTLEIGIIENLQREDLNVIELALGYKTLMEDHSMTQEEVASKVGKSRPVIANTVRLLALPDDILEMLKKDVITSGHARALLALEDEELMSQIAGKIVKDKLLVRDIEKLARKEKQAKLSGVKPKKEELHSSPSWGNSYYKEVELALKEQLGRKATLNEKDGKTTLTLEFYSKEELDDFLTMISTK